MDKRIPVTVRDKIAKAPSDALYICGNSDFVIEFDFDGDWGEYDTKTARFVWNGQHEDKIFSGNECPVPIISDTHSFRVGVFAGNLRTTTSAYVPAKKSILCEHGSPATPRDDVYAQIMELLKTGVSDEQVEKAVQEYLEEHPIGGGVSFETDDTLTLKDGILRVNTADTVEQDNTLPVTSAAVFTEVGNINALLATI